MGLSTTSSAPRAAQSQQAPKQEEQKGFWDTLLNIRRDTPLDQPEIKKRLEAAKANKDPLSIDDFRTRQASIDYNLKDKLGSKEYQNLSPMGKVLGRSMYYDNTIAPSFQKAGMDYLLTPEFKRQWMVATIDPRFLTDPTDEFQGKWGQAAGRTGAGLAYGATDLLLAGARFAHRQWMGMHTNAYDYAPTTTTPEQAGEEAFQKYREGWDKGFNNYVEKAYNWAENKLQFINDSSSSWMDMHPANSYTSAAGGALGVFGGQLPFYEALGAGIGAAARLPMEAIEAGALAKREEMIGAAATRANAMQRLAASKVIRGVNLTNDLMETVPGKLIAAQLRGAAEGYTMATIKGKEGADRWEEAATWGLQNLAFEPVAMAVGWAGRQFFGKMAALGGKSLIGNMVDAALADALNINMGIRVEPSEGPIRLGREFAGKGRISIIPQADRSGTANETGNVVFGGKVYPYSNGAEMQQHLENLAKEAQETRAKEDPVLHQTTKATETIMQDVNKQVNGTESLKESAEKDKEDGGKRIEKVVEAVSEGVHQAEAEAPIHAQDIVEQEQAKKIAENGKRNPDAAKWNSVFKKAGYAPEKEVAKNLAKQTARRTGNTNSDERVTDLEKISTPAKARNGDMSASYSLEEALGPDAVKEMKRQRLKTLETLGSSVKEGKAYFRNPSKKGFQLGSDRIAADGTRVGARDKREWHEIMSQEKTDDYVNTLKIAYGDGINFENPDHLLLFHWGNLRGIKGLTSTPEGKAQYDKIYNELGKAFNDEKKGIKYGAKDWDKGSDNLGLHLIQLAKTGATNEHGGLQVVFNSSNFIEPPTQWQFELTNDVERDEMSLLGHVLRDYPEALEFMTAGVQALQVKRRATYTADEWIRYNRMINSLVAGEMHPEAEKELEAQGLW